MAKKYLLYIHAPEFETEPKKSELVNALLNNHYKGLGVPPYGTHYAPKPTFPEKVEETQYEPTDDWGA